MLLTDRLEMSVLCQDIVILTLLAPDMSMFKVIAFVLQQNFNNISSIWFTLKSVIDKALTLT